MSTHIYTVMHFYSRYFNFAKTVAKQNKHFTHLNTMVTKCSNTVFTFLIFSWPYVAYDKEHEQVVIKTY